VEATAPLSIDVLLTRTVELGASDLHVTVGAAPATRVRGELVPLEGTQHLDADTTRSLMYRIMTTEQQKRFEIERQLDFSYGVPASRASASTSTSSVTASRPPSASSPTS
jgi:Tfp pilus assembly protein, pilus retraction ATPase PilT